MRYYADDPLVKRILGLRRLPDVATVSRRGVSASAADQESVRRLQRLLRDGVLARLTALELPRATLDFDGLAQDDGPRGRRWGLTARKRASAVITRSFRTLAQTGQVFDVLHRSRQRP